MIYKIRLKLAELVFRLGKLIHPDIALLREQIAIAHHDVSQTNIFVRSEIK